MPWEDRPRGSHEVVWRSNCNPIIPRDLIPDANSIFNSAVVPFEDGFAGVFRVDNRKREMRVHRGR
ncbi:MAG: glycosidase, partial [Anaerolineae bacterium]